MVPMDNIAYVGSRVESHDVESIATHMIAYGIGFLGQLTRVCQYLYLI
jgi:hypothetical protein